MHQSRIRSSPFAASEKPSPMQSSSVHTRGLTDDKLAAAKNLMLRLLCGCCGLTLPSLIVCNLPQIIELKAGGMPWKQHLDEPALTF